MTYKGLIKKSRTYDAVALVGTLGVIETNFHLLQNMLGDWYGLSYILVAAAFYYLRKVTTGPVGDK